ncbi:MAG: hypothetical protein V4511_08525 [Bacteroidota bacterium]
MENQRGELKFDVQITDVTNKCLLKINSTYESAALIYHTLKDFNGDFVPPIETDSLAIRITVPGVEEVPIKEKAMNWLFRKVFEDFIVGINESLIEAYKFVNYLELRNRSKQESFTHEKMQHEIDLINTKSLKMHIPKLIEDIEKGIGKNLYLREEILSINKVRNCLVHRNGKVGLSDTTNNEKNALELKCRELKIYRDQGDDMIPVTAEDKKKGLKVNKIGHKVISKIVVYPIDTHVLIESNVQNAVTYTCIMFAHELLNVLPGNGYTPKDLSFDLVTN